MPMEQARWAVLLDVDGILLDFPDKTKPSVVSQDLLRLLGGLHRALDGALALISGCDLNDIDKLFGRTPWAVAASCGLELRHVDGSFRRQNVESDSLARMHETVAELASRLKGVHLKETPLTATLHCDDEAEYLIALRTASKAVSNQLPGYELQADQHSLEFRPRGMNKGLAAREFLRHPAFSGRTPVCLGCDHTHESAFNRVNRANGISVSVGNPEPVLARFSLPDSAAARVWLCDVTQALSAANPRPARPLLRGSGLAR
jgi:trehalose 6-phosphate phosphatase